MSAEFTHRPPTVDARAAARWAQLRSSDSSPWLHEEVGRRMEDRLQWIKAQPRHWIDWAPWRGGLQAHGRVALRYPRAQAHVIEPEANLRDASRRALAQPWWKAARWRQAQPQWAGQLPEGGVDLLWANMSLHMAADPEALIRHWHQQVAVDGFLMFSCLGPDTLRELHALYASQGWPAASHEFTDMHDWGDMLVHAGFAEPVMDMERIVLTWASAQEALAELRTLGRNLHPARFAALRGRRWRDALVHALGQPAHEGTGPEAPRVALSFEVIYGHAFRPAPKVALAAESAVSLRDMRAMLHRGGP